MHGIPEFNRKSKLCQLLSAFRTFSKSPSRFVPRHCQNVIELGRAQARLFYFVQRGRRRNRDERKHEFARYGRVHQRK